MNSSISSFRFTKITLSSFGIIVAILTFSAKQLNLNNDYRGWMDNNVIRGQSYCHSDNLNKIVVAGSSASTEIGKTFNKELSNISMAAFSSSTGLEIIKRCNLNPTILFIEINHVYKGPSQEILDNIFIKHSFNHFLFLREYKFIPQLIGNLKDFLSKYINRNEESIISQKKRFEKNLDTIYDNYWAGEFDEKDISSNINLFIEQIKYFHKRGIKVILFELPMHQKLYSSKKYAFVKEILEQRFKENGMIYHKFGKFEDYDTEDGIHFKTESTMKIDQFLISHIKQIKSY